MTIKQLTMKVMDQLREHGLEDDHQIAVWIFCHVLNCNSAHLIAHESSTLQSKEISTISTMAERCANHEPVQYVTGHTEFYGLSFHVSPDVLIPRPETEQLVELALQEIKTFGAARALDIGTGSGCIALAMKHAFPQMSVTACDLSESALEIANVNAQKLNLPLHLIHTDVMSDHFVHDVGKGYQLVISNPPYIPDVEYSELPRMVRDFEPSSALNCGKDPLKYYRSIRDHLDRGLVDNGGFLTLETHVDYVESVCSLFSERNQLQVDVRKDFSGKPRFVIVKFLE